MAAWLRAHAPALGGLVGAVLSLVIAFGVQLSATQIGAIMAVVAAALGVLGQTTPTPSSSSSSSSSPAK